LNVRVLLYQGKNRTKTGTGMATTRFKKGVSGNPKGRPPKTAEDFCLDKACRSKAPDALETLCSIMETGTEANKLKAATVILERGYGKPKEYVKAEVVEEERELNREELIAELRRRGLPTHVLEE
jgi:hypothetical protein